MGGETLDEFWRHTPLTFKAFLTGRGRALEEAQKARAWLAHTTAALTRAKRLPSLDKMLGKPRPRRRQTPAEIMRIFKQHNAVMGGEIIH